MQDRDSHDALEAQVTSRSAATASAASGLLVTARARQLAFVDLAAAATAALAEHEGSNTEDSMAVLARHSARFDVLQVQLDPITGKHLGVAGLRTVQVWSVLPSGKVQDRLPVHLPTPEALVAAGTTAGLQHQSAATAGGPYMDLVLDIAWLPASHTCLAVTMPLAVVVFDLAVSARRPSVVVMLPSTDFIASSAMGQHLVAHTEGSASQLQICLVILTREATLWTASLSDSPASKAASASRNATTLTVQTATTVDPKALQATLPVDSSAPAKLVMYGKSICYCATTGMYIASLGNAYDEEQNVTWLLTISNDGPTIAQVSPVHVTSSPSNADSDTESASSAESAGRQHPDPESDAEHAEGGEAEDHHAEGGSDNGSADQTTLPSVERSYAIPVLPVSRQEMQSPGLVLGVPSHGLPGLMATVFEAAHNDGSGCALVSQMHDIEDAEAQVVGIASLPLPHAQQVAVVALDSQGLLHLFFTPMSTAWEAAHSPGLAGTGQQGRSGTALSASRGAASSQEQQGGVDNAGTGGARARMLERLLLGSTSSLSSSDQSAGLTAVGRAMTTGAEGSFGPAPAAALAPVQFPFDFFERSRCISASVRLSRDLGQTGGSERAWRQLLSATPLESPTASGMRINIRPEDSSLIVVGVRVSVGSSGAQHCPSQVTLGGRPHHLPPAPTKRWYSLQMTPAEALAAAPETPLQASTLYELVISMPLQLLCP
ncbi:hypothetical protein ABBQ38_012748 [Trebouxia sp. C0009 RCD-2024]